MFGGPLVNRDRVCAADHGFIRQRKCHAVILLAESCDLVANARLLPAKIIGRHADDDQPLVFVGLPQFFQPIKLRGEATF